MSWTQARRIAAEAALPLPVLHRPLAECTGLVLGESLPALVDLPPFATSAMDGWAVAGPGPWHVAGRVLAGQDPPRLADGDAVEIATGARLPPGASAVLRYEHGTIVEGRLTVVESAVGAKPAHDHAPHTASPPSPPAPASSASSASDFTDPWTTTTRGRVFSGSASNHDAARAAHIAVNLPIGADIRPQGQESRRGETLLSPGTRVTPAVLGLAAAAGYDTLPVYERPRVTLLVIGDELATSGLPGGSRVRDALGPMLAAWLRSLDVEVTTRHVADDAETILAAVASSPDDVVVTTGGTARGPVDHVHTVLAKLDARLLVDGVAVRPGHPMLLAEHGGTKRHRRFVAGLPGNPLAAVAGFVTLVRPLLRRMAGRTETSLFLPLRDAVTSHPGDTRLVPVSIADGCAVPLRFTGPAMLRGLALADGLAAVPPGGGGAGQRVEVLPT